MEKKDLIDLLNSTFNPLGFKRKGNNWVFNGNEISKVLNLQKSNYNSSFYINYGFNIKKLFLTTTTHIEHRLASTDKEEQRRINELLTLDNDILDEERISELEKLITNKIVVKFKAINTEEDLSNEVKTQLNLNNIPLNVKKHFNLL